MNKYILVLAATFALVTTAHFGWDHSKSDLATICDGICLLLLAIAFKK